MMPSDAAATESRLPQGADPPEGAAAAKVELRGIHHSFRDESGRPLPVLDGLDLVAQENQFVAIVGPTGSGKSTLFHILAGLLNPTSGAVLLDGDDITGSPGHVAYMMQKDLLLAWRRVVDNVALGPELAGERRAVARERARALMPLFGLSGFEDFYPAGLSGGMRQRVALMRTFLCDRSLLLLDEPFSALDALTRAGMHDWLLSTWPSLGRAGLLITHDVEEALLLADEVLVLSPRPGRIVDRVRSPFPGPRGRDLLRERRFGELKLHLLERLGLSTAGGAP